jgi:hypothetical protein
MDWTMVENAAGTSQRLQTILYLLYFRYEVDAKTAGARFKEDVTSGNQLCVEVMNELRTELASPSINLGLGSLISETEARRYLADVLMAFDNARLTSR